MGIGTESAMLNELRKIAKQQETMIRLLAELLTEMQMRPTINQQRQMAGLPPWQEPA